MNPRPIRSPQHRGRAEWADGIILGSPTRFGGPSSELTGLKLEGLGALWIQNKLGGQGRRGVHLDLRPARRAPRRRSWRSIPPWRTWGLVIVPNGYTAHPARVRPARPMARPRSRSAWIAAHRPTPIWRSRATRADRGGGEVMAALRTLREGQRPSRLGANRTFSTWISGVIFRDLWPRRRRSNLDAYGRRLPAKGGQLR